MSKITFKFDKGEASIEALLAVLTSQEASGADAVKVSSYMNGDVRELTLVKAEPKRPVPMSHTI